MLYIQFYKRRSSLFGGQDELIGSTKWPTTKLPLDEMIDLWLEGQTIDRNPFEIHLLFFKTLKDNYKRGILAQYGHPLKSIPLRVDVGDILLMNNPDLITQVAKWSTWSQWDHVAIVCRQKGHKTLRILEATSEGVHTYRIEEALMAYRTTSVIGLRRLLVQRTPAMIDALTQFVEGLSKSLSIQN